jgi:hypothetical protein
MRNLNQIKKLLKLGLELISIVWVCITQHKLIIPICWVAKDGWNS